MSDLISYTTISELKTVQSKACGLFTEKYSHFYLTYFTDLFVPHVQPKTRRNEVYFLSAEERLGSMVVRRYLTDSNPPGG